MTRVSAFICKASPLLFHMICFSYILDYYFFMYVKKNTMCWMPFKKCASLKHKDSILSSHRKINFILFCRGNKKNIPSCWQKWFIWWIIHHSLELNFPNVNQLIDIVNEMLQHEQCSRWHAVKGDAVTIIVLEKSMDFTFIFCTI